ncbi:MAG TPA: Rieske (2Fe-2S) protein, partial [Chloroflexota bacterium]|nr:Rieske (2Fe-2S) protein [Chloroflexota bacterium]
MSESEGSKLRVGSIADLVEKERVVVSGGRHGIVVFHHEGKIYAVDNRCPHMGFPLSKGSLRCGILTCHWHHARFDLASGGTFDPFADDVRVYPTAVQDGIVWVDLKPAPGDRVRKAFDRLRDGLEQNLSLVIVKSLLTLLDARVSSGEILTVAGAFGATYRAAGWGPGLTILTAMANVVKQLGPDEQALALFHGLSHVADDCQGQPPRFDRDPLLATDATAQRLKVWFREFVEVRDVDGAERVLRTAIQEGMTASEIADMMLAAATDHYFLNGGHTIDFLNKAFEFLDCAGWDHASEILPSLITGLCRAQRSEESNAWRHPIDLIDLVEPVLGRLGELVKRAGTVSLAEPELNRIVEILLGDDPVAIVKALEAALESGVVPLDLATALAAAAGLRVARFHTSNEFGDWITVLHTFSYASALQQLLKRAPSAEGMRGVFHGAMRLYLDRFLNVPSARLPGPEDQGAADSHAGDAERILDELLTVLDRQQQVNP